MVFKKTSVESTANGHIAVPKKSRTCNRRIAAMLAVFLGLLGAHKFYLGNWKAGLIYFAITFLTMVASGLVGQLLPYAAFGVFCCVEGIVYALRSDEEFQRINVDGGKVIL